MPTAKRQKVFAILQLCFVSTMILWVAGYPFLGDVYERKEQLLLYQFVMGGGETIARGGADPQQLERNAARFATLPGADQQQLLEGYKRLYEAGQEPFRSKLARGIRLLVLETSPLLRLWMILAITGALMVLRERPGSDIVGWLTLSAALSFAIINGFFGAAAPPRADLALFPEEQYLIKRFSDGKPAQGIAAQHTQLVQAWDSYLATEWSQDGDAEAGQWRFTLERLRRLHQQAPLPDALAWRQRWGWGALALFVAWALLLKWKG